MSNLLPDVQFNEQEDIDWRDIPDESLDDDMPLEKTPDDVIEMLGFDPLELNEA